MAEHSKIEWCDHTFNPWVGCTKVSAACDHCYAEGWAKRTGQAGLWTGERRRTSAANWKQPLVWDRKAAAAGARAKVFCASLADVFDNHVPDEWRADLWLLISATPHLDWLLLTKRPQNIEKMLPRMASVPGLTWPWPNVWLGTTAENREQYGHRWAHLPMVPSHLRFLSAEPLLEDLGHLHLERDDAPRWIIAGGESGASARPMHPDWARSLRDQCQAAGVQFFFKQWGGWAPCKDEDLPNSFTDNRMSDFTCLSSCGHSGNTIGAAFAHKPPRYPGCFPTGEDGDAICNPTWMRRVGKKAAGALLDGREWREMPR